jgi:hypothetical protein
MYRALGLISSTEKRKKDYKHMNGIWSSDSAKELI